MSKHFYPRPPRGGRPSRDTDEYINKEFLSTPSARRATCWIRNSTVTEEISIHALREEGDGGRSTIIVDDKIFLSTPSARRATYECRLCDVLVSFLSTPSARRATWSVRTTARPIIFLSTPSARRATAKTETKSLFSNKLYNILHEFRRALIYSGSKNYPNHAKRLKNLVRRCRKDAENSPFAPGRETQNNSRPSCSKGG